MALLQASDVNCYIRIINEDKDNKITDIFMEPQGKYKFELLIADGMVIPHLAPILHMKK